MSSSNGSSDTKKRKLPPNNEDAILESSTKKIKVQAQRKFAQNAVTPTSTLQKSIQTPLVPNIVPVKPPIKRPNTEDFLTFLCFRGTSLLPPRLDFFNKPQRSLSAQEIAAGKKRRKSTPILPVSSTNNGANTVNNELTIRKSIRSSSLLLPQSKYSLTKLGQKVIGRNLVRSSSRYTARQEALTLRQLALHHGSKIKPKPKVNKPPVKEEVKKEIKKNEKQVSLDGKQIQQLKGRITRSNSLPSVFCPVINQLRDDKGKWCKGGNKPSSKTSEDSKDVEEERPSRRKTASKIVDHRSNSLGNIKRMTSDIKCKETNKNDRKTRSLASKYKNSDQDNYIVPDKKSNKNSKDILSKNNNKANSVIETKLTVDVKRRTSSVDNVKLSRENKDIISSSTRSRPPRRTKVAATIFMEMLRKDMRCSDEQEDDSSSLESFPDLPNTRIHEQRERELKVFSKKNKIEKQQDEQQQSTENKDNKLSSSVISDNKKTVVGKKKMVAVKEKKMDEGMKTVEKKKPPKEVAETIPIHDENCGTTRFKRNLRPRRSSTMLDDYIMTDSDEDEGRLEEKPSIAVETKKCGETASKLPLSTTKTVGGSKSQKCKLSSTEESTKKNLKINKTDMKLKKDLNKMDSEVKKSLSETKSKSILLIKHDKEPEIKNNKTCTVADKKTVKLSKHKTENLAITKEANNKITGDGSKNAGKKVPPINNNNNSNSSRSSSISSSSSSSSSNSSSTTTNNNNKQQQQLSKKENTLKNKKSNLDLYNNNNNKMLSSSIASSSSSIFTSGIDSQTTRKELLEHMAANFDPKSPSITTTAIVEDGGKAAVNVDGLVKEKNSIVEESAAVEKNLIADDNKKSISTNDKQEFKIVSKMENVMIAEEKEKVVAVMDKVAKTESLVVPFDKVEKVENMVFQTIAKDLFLSGQQKEIKITMPEYLSSNSFQLPNRFKQHDGLSVLSEICSALPRFNEPFLSNRQLLNNKLSTAIESSFVKYEQPSLLPSPPLTLITTITTTTTTTVTTTIDKKKKEDKPSSVMAVVPPPPLLPPSFESRTVKIMNLARGGCNNTAVTNTVGGGTLNNDKRDLTTSWRQAFKNVKLPKNGLTSATVSVGNNLISWTKKNQSNNVQLPKTKTTCIDDLAAKTTTSIPLQSSSLLQVNDVTTDKKTISKTHSRLCKKTCCELKTMTTVNAAASYLAKTTILNSTKYDLKFEKRSSAMASSVGVERQQHQQRKDAIGDVSSLDDQNSEKKIFHQRRLSTNQSCSGNSSDAFSPDNETSVYAFQPDLPVTSTPFRRNKPQSPAKSRTVSPNTSIAVSIENDSMEEKSHQSAVSSSTDVDSEEGRLFYIPLPAGVQAQPLIQGVTVKLGTEGPQNKLVMSAKLVTKPPASTIPVSSISPKLERKIKPLCTTKITNSTTPVGTVQPTTRSVQPPKCTPSTSNQELPLLSELHVPETKDEKKRLQQITSTTTATTTNITTTTNTTTAISTTSTAKESKKSLILSSTFSTPNSDNKKSKKTEKQVVVNKRKCTEKVASKKKFLKACADMLDAPTFYPSEEDFKDPLEYFEIIKPVAQRYGICRVVPPPSFKPDCKVTDDMRFTAYNQYVHKMMNRWGPNVREMMAMKKYLETQSIVLSNPPLIGGMEVDLPRLYHTVQDLGGLKEVIEMDKWCRVADLMKIPKSAQDRVTKLDDIYCKYLLPYDTLSHEERQKLISEVEKEWKQICKKGDIENELYEDINDCITKGRSIALSAYYRVARNTVAMWFRDQQQQQQHVPQGGHLLTSNKLSAVSLRAEDVESLYWKQVQDRKNHICVLSGSIDSGAEGYGFPITKTATFTKHPWNLKVLTNNSVSVLKSLGPVMGMTVPTIHMGMVFSACCWYKDPHGLPWIEYLHTGADKVWYGVPSDQNDKFRAAMKRLLPRAVAEGKNHHTWLAADSGMVPPEKLLEHGVTLTRTVQNPGQFLIVMPRAYTCNVSTGYVISESVYFTQRGWINDAEKIFQDLQRNCEPAAFSFEKLLINMSTDSRTPQHLLKQLLNILSNMRDCEIALRSQLVEDLGLKASERIRSKTSKSNEQNEDYECDVCHSILYISMVNNSQEDCYYCLRHGIEILSKKHNQLKYCKFLYTFDENELDSILVKLRERIVLKKKKQSIKS